MVEIIPYIYEGIFKINYDILNDSHYEIICLDFYSSNKRQKKSDKN